ncbi:hypothetical protein AMTRI_Chr09g36810 [Amborella trichopoda]|uniref:Uncharacterized protein n=1 Tax=Amborella trichopoda TaxID=13333 RepID=W1NM24_AMBTC|nr:uncharacterized protein LOC110008556 [Amborella trichopoda]ERM96571.1 hypothetical protein AMTR_s00001p00269830 [Amborella trichopoda]|eukprot:XP_020532242.1 uncharacterized protein LOC110008556 [Amborella trichopoda]
MASSSMKLRLKQSSLHSFLFPTSEIATTTKTHEAFLTLPNSNNNTTSYNDEIQIHCKIGTTDDNIRLDEDCSNNSIDGDDNVIQMNDYERERQDNIQRNLQFLNSLGILPSLNPNKCNKRKKTSKPNKKPPEASVDSPLPLRRSTRKRSLPNQGENDTSKEEGEDTKEEGCLVFEDSSVFNYGCHAGGTLPSPHPVSGSISGFQKVGKLFSDPLLTKIYALNFSHLGGERKASLLAAGGHGGYVSVYGIPTDFQGEGEEKEEEGEEGGNSLEGPLMSWKCGMSWVSGVEFVDENPMLLVSSCDDGGIVVWDVRKRICGGCSPQMVGESRDVHSSGVFSMDHMKDSYGTASKDSSVALCRLSSSGGGMVIERRISGHHCGPVRGISFRDVNVLADCGADGRICILDKRMSEQPCSLFIDSDHSTGVNMAKWCPSNESILLSASKDPYLLLYDIRAPSQPLHKLEGHVSANIRTCYRIYKPVFIDNGKAVATPGQGSRNISLYNVDTGKAISRGVIGYDANIMKYIEGDTGPQQLFVAGRQIDQLFPILS